MLIGDLTHQCRKFQILLWSTFIAALRGESTSVADPFVSDPILNYPVKVVLALIQLSLFLESRPFGMGTNIECSRVLRFFTFWDLIAFIGCISSLDVDHITFINCAANKICLKLNRVYHRRDSRVITGTTTQRLDIISKLQSDLKKFQESAMQEWAPPYCIYVRY